MGRFDPHPDQIVDRRGPSKPTECNVGKSLTESLAELDQDRWAECCRAMEVQVARRNFGGAHAALDGFVATLGPKLATLDSEVGSVFPVRIANALEDMGLLTIKAVLAVEPTDLVRRQIGQKIVAEIVKTCRDVVAGKVREH